MCIRLSTLLSIFVAMARPAAFFDLDRTLIDCNSGMEWAKHEFKQGNISTFQLAKASLWMGLYHLSLIDIEKAYRQAVTHYAGEPVEAVDRRTREWFHDDISHRLRDAARGALEDHREQNHPLVILTNSTCFEASVAAETWNFDDWLANRFPADDDGMLTGTFETPLCYGEGKVEYATDWARDHDVDIDASYFYSDSLSDLPMLERVGHPRIVDPDPRLRREARNRDWPILDW